MPYCEFKCKNCGRHFYAFDTEVDGRESECDSPQYERLPPDPCIIHATESFMSDPILDSADTGIELDRILTREARNLKMDKQVNDARRNM